MPTPPILALGSQMESRLSGIRYTKTAPDRWEPSPEGRAWGWQPFTISDAALLAHRDYLPRSIRGRTRTR